MLLSSILVVLILCILITSTAKFLWRKKELYWASLKFHGPVALPIVGNALYFLCKDEEILSVIYSLSQKYKSPIRFWLGPVLLLVSTKPAHVEKILSSTKFSHKHDLYELVKIYLGDGLVSGSGPKYKTHKRIIQPMFNLKYCQNQIEIMEHFTNICLYNLDKFVEQGTFDIHLITHKCFVDIIGEVILGTDMKCQNNEYTNFCKAAVDMYRVGFRRLTRPWLHPDFLYNLSGEKKDQDRIVKNIRGYMSTVVKKSWERISSENYKVSEWSPVIDQITVYIQDNPESINNEDFISHMITLFAAAEDTMTIITSFVIVCMGMYPEYQKKAIDEIRTVFGDVSRPITYDDITKLNYLDMCIKDVERLCPIAPYILRKCFDNVKIDNTWTIPKGACVVVPIFNVHRDPDHWENPTHFHPDHFLSEHVAKRHAYAYVPFSAGPRGCIGKIFSNICLKVFLVKFLQRFEVEADGKFPDIRLKMDVSTRPIDGYNVRIKKRV